MSPTVFREKGFRFYFFSLEEDRMHVHVACADGDAKFWLTPQVELAMTKGIRPQQLKVIQKIIQEHHHEIADAWRQHLDS